MARKRRCIGTVGNPKSERYGQQCRNYAGPGSDFCNKHAGADGGSDVDALRNRCIRRKKNGEQCRNPAVPGSTICMKHGQNRFSLAAAQRRLASFTDPALSTLYDLMVKPETSDSDRGRYALAIIDRVGLGPRAQIDLDVGIKPWESVMQKIIREVPEEIAAEMAADPAIIDAEVVEPEVEVDYHPRMDLTQIIPPHSSAERATYVRPNRTADPPAHLA